MCFFFKIKMQEKDTKSTEIIDTTNMVKTLKLNNISGDKNHNI